MDPTTPYGTQQTGRLGDVLQGLRIGRAGPAEDDRVVGTGSGLEQAAYADLGEDPVRPKRGYGGDGWIEAGGPGDVDVDVIARGQQKRHDDAVAAGCAYGVVDRRLLHIDIGREDLAVMSFAANGLDQAGDRSTAVDVSGSVTAKDQRCAHGRSPMS